MPYIKKDYREPFDYFLDELLPIITDPGELNYCITRLVHGFTDFNEKSYSTLNSCIGALEAAKLEFYRRVVIPYENEKIFENGDI